MPHPKWNSFIAYVTRKIRAILKKIDQGEEEEQQNGMHRGAIVQTEEGEEQHKKERICENLPDEMMIESILTRLPVRTLAICCCVSKLWYNSILNDSRFSMIHNMQNKNKVFLVFNLLNIMKEGSEKVFFFSLSGGEKADIRVRFLSCFSGQCTHELVGFCNGLACVKLVNATGDAYGSITLVNRMRDEGLVLAYVPPTEGYIYLCHGFGFDSLLQVYKAVIIFTSDAKAEILCLVITLGTMSWRKIITSTFDISAPSGMVIRVPKILWRAATLCGGDLFWRTQNQIGNNTDIKMLLTFDLHSEKIHFIRLPPECTLTISTNERQYVVVDHLLEFKGYPCVARSEGITTSNNDHGGHRCNYQTGVCCCCYKIHMYILKDTDKQVWTREETFNVQIMDQEGLQPTPLCCYFDISAAKVPTRILTLSDQVLLYWFNGERLIFYNLHEKHLKVVECFRSYPHIFKSKMNEDLGRCIGADDNIYCPSMDYQLHAQPENIIYLKTFIPKGANTIKTDCADELNALLDKNIAAGWLSVGRIKHTYYAFL